MLDALERFVHRDRGQDGVGVVELRDQRSHQGGCRQRTRSVVDDHALGADPLQAVPDGILASLTPGHYLGI